MSVEDWKMRERRQKENNITLQAFISKGFLGLNERKRDTTE